MHEFKHPALREDAMKLPLDDDDTGRHKIDLSRIYTESKLNYMLFNGPSPCFKTRKR